MHSVHRRTGATERRERPRGGGGGGLGSPARYCELPGHSRAATGNACVELSDASVQHGIHQTHTGLQTSFVFVFHDRDAMAHQ